jgi:hypothetical protein
VSLTKEQYHELADTLQGTGINVYRLAETRFGYAWTDEDFDSMETMAGLFKCVSCDEWKDTNEKDRDFGEYCEGCVEEMDAESGEDE